MYHHKATVYITVLLLILQVREAQPLIIQSDVMHEEMTSCCQVEYTAKSIPLLLHQVSLKKRKSHKSQVIHVLISSRSSLDQLMVMLGKLIDGRLSFTLVI